MSGDPYIKENEWLEAEIARLEATLTHYEHEAVKDSEENARLQAALEEIAKHEITKYTDEGADILITIARKALAKEGK